MSAAETLRVGIVIERRDIDSRWADHAWMPVAVIPGAAPLDEPNAWLPLQSGEGWQHFMAGTLDIDLYRKETEGYRVNLSNEPPHVYVVLTRGIEADDPEVMPFMVTVCPYEAEKAMEGDDNLVEGVPMPDEIAAWVQDFIEAHHVEEPFKKRKNRPYDPRTGDLSRPPPVQRPRGGDDDG